MAGRQSGEGWTLSTLSRFGATNEKGRPAQVKQQRAPITRTAIFPAVLPSYYRPKRHTRPLSSLMLFCEPPPKCVYRYST